MKYIIFQDFSGQAVPFLFPEKVAHSDMREQMPYSTVLSAGYVSITDGNFTCSGGDADIGAVSQDGDAACIAQFFQKKSSCS